MSDTPRTDKERESDNGDSSLAYDFAERLERELAAMTKERDDLKKECDEWYSKLKDEGA